MQWWNEKALIIHEKMHHWFNKQEKITTKLKQNHNILIYDLFFGFVLVKSWELLLLLTDNSTIWAEVIFKRELHRILF